MRTFVLPYDPVIVREAILREHYRGGQSFFVVPRISDLPEMETFLRDQVPEVSVVTAHGQMAEDELERIFEPFYRSQTGRRFPQGMGLGLSIAHDLVVAHDGRIEVASETGQGSQFTIWLPLSPEVSRAAPVDQQSVTGE